MVFNSLIFILFLTIVLLIYHLPLPWGVKKIHLWISSYLFYAAWNPPFVILLWISTLVDWFAGKYMASAKKPSQKRAFLIISLSANLGILGYFKYGEFLLDSFITLLNIFNIPFHPVAPDIVLPVGISFYTFQSLSYTFDIYRGKMLPWQSFSDFALFVTFFPQLVAGPIVRAADFLPQLESPRQVSGSQMGWGFSLLTIGLFQKIILADSFLATVADKVYSRADAAGFIDAWIGTLAFSGQIFFDFSGYSNCAIGAALCLGFIIPGNFRSPYASVGFAEFWRRWHISLSTWLRDYLYISLGGNRKGHWQTLKNLMVTMLLGGLWHGASWRFVFWGGLHGLYLIFERGLRSIFKNMVFFEKTFPRIGLMLITQIFLCITWVFFRSEDFASAFVMVLAMINPGGGILVDRGEILRVVIVYGLLMCFHWSLRNSSLESLAGNLPWWIRTVVIASLLISIVLAPVDERAFIYFQF